MASRPFAVMDLEGVFQAYENSTGSGAHWFASKLLETWLRALSVSLAKVFTRQFCDSLRTATHLAAFKGKPVAPVPQADLSPGDEATDHLLVCCMAQTTVYAVKKTRIGLVGQVLSINTLPWVIQSIQAEHASMATAAGPSVVHSWPSYAADYVRLRTQIEQALESIGSPIQMP